jgi:hypothetical protein
MLSAPEQAAPQPLTPPMGRQGEPLGLHLPTNRAAVVQVFHSLANGKTGEALGIAGEMVAGTIVTITEISWSACFDLIHQGQGCSPSLPQSGYQNQWQLSPTKGRSLLFSQ